MRQCRVDLVAMDHPGDVSAIAALFDRGEIEPGTVVAILGKTEGNGCVNDFTRGYAVTVLKALFAARLGLSPEEAGNRVSMIMSGGTEGGLSPHFLVFSIDETESTATPSLAIGAAFTRDLAPEEIGTLAQVEATAEAVRAAMAKAALTEPDGAVDVVAFFVGAALMVGPLSAQYQAHTPAELPLSPKQSSMLGQSLMKWHASSSPTSVNSSRARCCRATT